VSAALFLCVGVVYDRMHTREIAAYGGLVDRMPLLCRGVHGVHAPNTGTPGNVGIHRRVSDGFSARSDQQMAATLATLGVILSAAYSCGSYRKMMFGQLKPSLAGIRDLTAANPRPGAAGDPDDLFGTYPKPVPRHVGGLRGGAAGKL